MKNTNNHIKDIEVIIYIADVQLNLKTRLCSRSLIKSDLFFNYFFSLRPGVKPGFGRISVHTMFL